MSDRGLWELSTERLKDLETWLGRREGEQPVGSVELLGEGFTEKGTGVLIGLSSEAALTVVRTLMGERISGPLPALELVWSGPDPTGAESRETRQVVRHLFQTAEKSVVVAGFAFWKARDIFEPLHARAREVQLELDFFIHVDPRGRPRDLRELHRARPRQQHRAGRSGQGCFVRHARRRAPAVTRRGAPFSQAVCHGSDLLAQLLT